MVNNRAFVELTLGEVLDRVIGGGTPSRDVNDFYTGDIPWATVKDLKSTQLFDTLEHITADAVQNSAANVVPAGTVVMATRMAVGKCFMAMVDMAINQDLKALFPKTDQLLAEYLMRWLEYKQSMFEAMGTGTTVKGVRLEQIKTLPIALPPFTEQSKIATILMSVDDAVAATQRIINQTEVVKHGLMQQLLTKGIGHTTFKHTEIGEIPTEWEVVQLDDIAPNDKPVVQTGPFGAQLKSEDFTSSGIPVLNIGNVLYGKMTFDKLDFLPLDKAELLQRYAVSEGDLLFSRMATVGRTSVVPAQCKGWLISYHLMRLSVDKHKCNPFFLMYSFIGNSSIVRQIEAISGGGTRAGVNTSILKTLKFAMPPIQEQNRIVCVLESFDKRISTESDYYQRLNTLKQGLMQVLLTGKVRVNVDEPSEVSV